MPNIPWDLLAGRLGRYLQLSYISAAIAGLCITGEIVILNLNGTPAHRRQVISGAVANAVGNHKSFWQAALIIAIAIILAFVVGASARYLVITVYLFVRSVFVALFSVTGLQAKWYRTKERLEAQIRPLDIKHESFSAPKSTYRSSPMPSKSLSTRRIMRRPREIAIGGTKYDLTHPLGIMAYIWTTMHIHNPTGRQLWEALTTVYGEERVSSALAAHPIPVPIEETWQVLGVIEYCRLWLNKYAPEMAVTATEIGLLIASTAFIPILLLPKSLVAAFGATASIQRWAWLWPIAILFLLYKIMTSYRSPRRTSQIFFRFVTAQLIEQSHTSPENQTKLSSRNNKQKDRP